MPIFRSHCGGLESSLATCKWFGNRADFVKYMREYLKRVHTVFHDYVISIDAYPDTENCFDKRTGWFTHSVTVALIRDGNEVDMFIAGFLSEDFVK